MTVRIGINPLTWTNDDLPELGAHIPLETCLSEAKQAGYAGIELGNKFPRNADVLKPILAPSGLQIVSGWYSGRLLERNLEEEKKAVEDHRVLLVAMGCKAMVWAEVSRCIHGDRRVPLSRRPVLADKEWPQFGERMTDIARHLAKSGLALAYHHHMGTVVQTEAEIDKLMAVTGDEVGLLLDTGHLTYAGGDPVRVARKHGKRIKHVHTKDVRRDVLDRALKEDWSFLDAVLAGVFTVPGDGAIDYRPVMAALADAHYAGWIVVEAEQDPEKAHPLTYARKGFDYLSKCVDKAGLRRVS
jgi:inosose dehydratase